MTHADSTPVPHLEKGTHWTAKFLAELATSPNVSGACRAAGVDRTTAYKRRHVDPEFAAAWDEALDRSTDSLVGEAYRRAFEGCEKPVFYRGEECGRVREYSDILTIFLLKAHRPLVYGDKIKHDFSSLSDEELLRRAEGLIGGGHPAGPDPA